MGTGNNQMSKDALKPHPLAELKPEATRAEIEAMKALIARQGQMVPITLLDGQILDGRRRYAACTALGVTPKTITYSGDDPVGFVQAQAATAEMSETRRALLGANLIGAYAGRWGGSRRKQGGTVASLNGKSSEIIALEVGVSPRLVRMAIEIQKKSKSLYAELMAGKIKTIKAAHTRMNHNQKLAEVKQLKRAAGVTLKDCDLRHGDNVTLMSAMADASVQTIFADSPYNNGWSYRDDPERDRLPDDKFLARCELWMHQCARLLKEGGSLFVLIDDRYSDHFGMLLRSMPSLVRRPTIICWETFGNYNSAETGLSQNARYLHWYTKGHKPLINTVEARVESDRQQIGDPRGVDHGRLPPNVWTLTRVTSQSKERCPWLGVKGNAPQLPRALPERCILLTSQPGDLVLDPFNGNGITGIAALVNDRRYIGIDRDDVGLKQARKWIAHEVKRLKGSPS